jgi:hypothetical protein
VYFNPWVEPPFFAKLSLNNGEVVELQGSGTLTKAMITPYKSSVVSAEIGELCTIIGNQTFYGCGGLKSITIPDSVTIIGNWAFEQCSGLTSITSLATKAPTITSDTFQNVKTGGTLRVPIGSTGYDVWMRTRDSYLGKYGWTKVEQ